MIEFLRSNYTWVLSGIGIVIPLSIIGWIISSKSKRQIQKSGHNSVNIQAGKSININNNTEKK